MIEAPTAECRRAPRYLLFAMLLSIGTHALAADPTPAVRARAAEIVQLFNGRADPDQIFSPTFLAQVPAAQIEAVGRQLVAQYGPAKAVSSINARSPTGAVVVVDFDRAVVRLALALEDAPPHRLTGLLVVATEVKGDSLAAIAKEMRELPGHVSVAVAELGGTPPRPGLSEKADTPLAVGSAFKLFLLAELSRAIKAGERRWSEVVPLGSHSIPTGLLQSWPEGAPLTLHSLAALMISQSDNSAADTLLSLLGRERVEALLPQLGVRDPGRLRPLLSTREAALLKAGGDAGLGGRWASAGEGERRALLAGPLATMRSDTIDTSKLMSAPKLIDTVEWFASTSDLVRVMDWLRTNGDAQTLAILAINPGIPQSTASDFAFVGYKGGSETGVMNMTFLLRDRKGTWQAVAATWNNSSRGLDEARFQLLVTRVITLLR